MKLTLQIAAGVLAALVLKSLLDLVALDLFAHALIRPANTQYGYPALPQP